MRSIDSVFKSNLFPQIYFQLRDGRIFCGAGISEEKSDLIFVQRDFSSQKTLTWSPQIFFETKNFDFLEADIKINVFNRKNEPDLDKWRNLFLKIHHEFCLNSFKKVVPARRVTFDLKEEIDELSFLKKISNKNHYNFLFKKNENDIFLGSSPEKLLSYHNEILSTEAIAGTRTKEQAHELLESSKDLHEHQLVVEDILQKISPYTNEITKDLKPKLIESKNLAHLKTSIEAKLHDKNILKIIDELHPTSAVCGMPKNESMNFILKNENFERDKYAGFLGVLGKNFADICVTLRSCQIVGRKLHLYSGVGVVPQSNAELEWQELEDKIQPYLKLLY